MMNRLSVSMFFLGALGAVTLVPGAATAGTFTPESFADTAISYTKGDDLVTYTNKDAAVGTNDWTSEMVNGGALGGWKENIGVSLGKGGSLVLEFTDNYLTGGGDSGSDLWIFEIGKAPEDVLVDISIDGETWYHAGLADKQDYANESGIGIDIDELLNSQAGLNTESLFSFVRLTDNGTNTYTNAKSGADIDAVAAISSVAKTTDVPEPAMVVALGMFTFGAIVGRKQR